MSYPRGLERMCSLFGTLMNTMVTTALNSQCKTSLTTSFGAARMAGAICVNTQGKVALLNPSSWGGLVLGDLESAELVSGLERQA